MCEPVCVNVCACRNSSVNICVYMTVGVSVGACVDRTVGMSVGICVDR